MELPVPTFIVDLLAFFESHLVFWLFGLTLVGEGWYLTRSGRAHEIAMSGWGSAKRAEQPVFFYFLWVLHVALSIFFLFVIATYLWKHLS